MSALPLGWQEFEFGSAFQVVSDGGRRLAASQYKPEGRFPVIDQGEQFVGGYTDDATLLYDGPLPVIVFGDHTRRVKLVWREFVVGAQGVRLLAPRECLDAAFAAYQLSTKEVPNRGYSRHFQFLRKMSVLVPPRSEQARIVAALEEQFSRIDAGVASLERVGRNLKRMRAAVLQAAVTGRLVPPSADEESAAELMKRVAGERHHAWTVGPQRRRYAEPESPANPSPRGLPPSWVWATVAQVSTVVTDGVHKKPNYVERGVPFVTVRNLTAGNGIDFTRLNYVSQADHEEFCKRTHPEQGDLLVSKDGTLGVVRAVRTSEAFSIFVSVALIKPVLRSMTDYLELALSSPLVQAQMVPKGSGLQHIHLEDLREDCVPVPPLREQERIVREAHRLLSEVDRLESLCEQAVSRSSALRRAVLTAAFSGRLVPHETT